MSGSKKVGTFKELKIVDSCGAETANKSAGGVKIYAASPGAMVSVVNGEPQGNVS